ncbi:hypothetical protein KW805_00390 [Candidatus Pacearchaeota archaeon]|nr:hypothetical protein [Candidatus Pacearchaeota archaeon]
MSDEQKLLYSIAARKQSPLLDDIHMMKETAEHNTRTPLYALYAISEHSLADLDDTPYDLTMQYCRTHDIPVRPMKSPQAVIDDIMDSDEGRFYACLNENTKDEDDLEHLCQGTHIVFVKRGN